MKITPISPNFNGYIKTYTSDKNTIKDYYDDNGVLTKRFETDEFNRFVDSKVFDEKGNIQETLHKDYYKTKTEEGCIETFKNKYQEYVRKSYTKIENGLKHVIDDFQSKTGKSYINDFVHDSSGNLIKIISNGKITELL